MKKLLLLIIVFTSVTSIINAQTTFSDDVESYSVGDYVAAKNPKWTTWDVKPGTATDAMVSNEKAHSGTKSIKCESTSTSGGPTDLILPFSTATSLTGTLEFEMYMYVVAGTGGYFNFQGDKPVGTTWALDVFFNDDATWDIASNGNSILEASGTYTQDAWIKISMNIDLTNNKWRIFFDDKLVANFNNNINKLYCMDLFPINANGISTFYVDDVKFKFTPAVLQANDATLLNAVVKPVGLKNQQTPLTLNVRNVGIQVLNSFDIKYDDGTGEKTASFTAQNLASLAVKKITLPTKLTFGTGSTPYKVYVTNANGGLDVNKSNDTLNSSIYGYVPAPGKKFFVEEGTGTWCQWCPRGAVYMDSLTKLYPNHFIGVAVHNADPMAVVEYDGALSPLLPGYPSVVLMRERIMDPSGMERPGLENVVLAPVAEMANVTKYDSSKSRELSVCVSTKFNKNLGAGYRLNCIITEDGVKGTASGYAQRNAYAGGASGVMGGYELLPATVPASRMVYDHVARAILGPFEGTPNSLPDVISAGDEYQYEYTYTLPAGFNANKMHVVSILIDPDGKVNNAQSIKLFDGVNKDCKVVTSIDNVLAKNTSVTLSPNPVNDDSKINFTLNSQYNVELRVLDIMGRILSTKDFGKLSGTQNLPLSSIDLSSGLYFAELRIGSEIRTITFNVK